MLYRQTKLLNLLTLADVGTYTFDLNVRDPITELWFHMTATNGATDNNGASLPQCITGIEILDGSDVIYSLTGMEAYGLACAWLGQMPRSYVDERPNMWHDFAFLLPFGRFAGDPSFGLDPSRFTNLQCRITTNLAAVNAVGATGFVTNTLQVTCLAHVLEGAGSPLAFFTHKRNYSFVSAAAGITYIDLPTDYPYLGLLLRVQAAGVWMALNISNVKLQCDQNKYIPFDLTLEDFWSYPRWQNPRFHYAHHYHLANTETAVSILKMDERMVMDVMVAGESECKYIGTGVGQAAVVLMTGGAADAVPRNEAAQVEGYFPYGTIWVPLGRREDPADWFDPSVYNSLRLELTNVAAGAACSVATCQVRPY